MREIKFRAWNKYHKKMYQVYELDFDSDIAGCKSIDKGSTHTFGFIDLELMQLTGLKDMNGVHIFEGDIIRIDYRVITGGYAGEYETDEGFYIGEVCFVPSTGYGLKNVIKHSDSEYAPTKRASLNRIVQSRSIVLGNIHQNSELLKQSK